MVLRGSHLSSLSFRIRVCHPNTRIYVRLLGPCFKTGRLKPFRQHPKRWCGKPTGLPTSNSQSASCLQAGFERRLGTQKMLQSSVQPKAGPEAITPKASSGSPSSGFLPQVKLMLTCQQTSAPCKNARLIICQQYWFQAFPFWQFHVLFNSLFKVLFIFPSRYLFAIGLSPIFSFRWYLPPILVCIPKQTDSWKTYHIGLNNGPKTGFSPSMMPRSKGLMPMSDPKTFL